ncbi:MAG: cyclic nucleotide-binding domain-containing protein [Hyphomonadaceae bacterium]|nr:MAG: CRP/FNR family transcriptional regulator transcriptional activator FtrB [Caulobacteraceae bacterium]MBT9445211.1 cyclic nucleotide-binding domain-containing protein [Hyphomonadaceae bacterium]
MRANDIPRVRALPIFANVSDDTFKRVTGTAYLQRFPSNTTLLMEGDVVDFLYVLLDGQVELQGTWKDKETTLAILRPVSSFILAAVVLDADALMSARTIERCEILMISGDAIRKTMAEDPVFGVAIARELSGCYRGLVRSIKNQKLRGGVERLANYLLTLRAKTEGGDTVRLPHEKRVLAALLGMTPENLSRAFSTLQGYGVEVNGADVRLGKVRDLERLARPDPLIDNHAPRAPDILAEADAELWSTERQRSGGGN